MTVVDDLIAELSEIQTEGEGVVTGKGFHIPEDEKWRLVPDFARDRDYPFFMSTAAYVLSVIMKWAEIKKENETEQAKRDAWLKVKNDLDQSDLLFRMLQGQEPLEFPPPKSFKHNWYEVVEDGFGIPQKVMFSKYKGGTGGWETWKDDDEYANIDEFSWKILEVRIAEDPGDCSVKQEFVVKYNDSYKVPKFILRQATEDEIKERLSPREYRATADKCKWILIQEGK